MTKQIGSTLIGYKQTGARRHQAKSASVPVERSLAKKGADPDVYLYPANHVYTGTAPLDNNFEFQL
jgi:hypothetical protein